jgi:hypothetical protein
MPSRPISSVSLKYTNPRAYHPPTPTPNHPAARPLPCSIPVGLLVGSSSRVFTSRKRPCLLRREAHCESPRTSGSPPTAFIAHTPPSRLAPACHRSRHLELRRAPAYSGRQFESFVSSVLLAPHLLPLSIALGSGGTTLITLDYLASSFLLLWRL